ncbi:MAG: hypothetical protein IJN54_01875 [Lachnospiraceae bacterium]|nr:hypothetical protein [Lachnospiraceae bacterium]
MSIKAQLQQITKKYDTKLNLVAEQVMLETKNMLREAVDELWYKSYSPTDYSRTYELIAAVEGKVIKNGQGNYCIEVYFDDALMSVNPSLYGWGTHSGFDKGDFRKGLIESIIHGIKGSNNNPRKGEATNVIEVVQQEATKYANGIIKKYI